MTREDWIEARINFLCQRENLDSVVADLAAKAMAQLYAGLHGQDASKWPSPTFDVYEDTDR